MKELHNAIVETGRMLQDASGSGCDAYEEVLRTHLHHLINIAAGELEREMEGFTDSPVSYRLPQEIMETLGLGENTQSQLPQDNAEAMAAAVDYADGWRPWGGGKQTYGGPVWVKLRDGKVSFGFSATHFIWNHAPENQLQYTRNDIVAWKPA